MSCGAACLNPNCDDPDAPEFLKCWKPENNAGCSCGKKDKLCDTATDNGPTYVRFTSVNRVLISL
jgi:hypothetical protein